MSGYEYVFPSVRGVQAGREFYASMCPLRLIPKILVFDEAELRPELRAQRILNKQRLPEMSQYLVENPKNYILSSLTASIDGAVVFEPFDTSTRGNNIGRLRIPMNSRIIINDGQHRRAAIEVALQKNPNLGDETISVVFFIDVGLKRCQQMFADLNRYAIRPSASLGILYDHRAEHAYLSREVVTRISVFKELTECERSSISNRSKKLFTLSGIHKANQILLANQKFDSRDERIEMAVWFWDTVAQSIVEWQLVLEGKASPFELRQEYIHSHALGLASIARVGNAVLCKKRNTIRKVLGKLKTIDWKRNSTQWIGRIGYSGRLSKNNINILLTANLIKTELGIQLSADEAEEETKFRKQNHGK